MKKIFVALISISLIACLSACGSTKNCFQFSQKSENIKTVEIYNVQQAYYEGNVHTLRDENEPIATVGAEELADFLEEVQRLEFCEEKSILPIPMDGGCDYYGYVLAIVYSDGGFDLLAEEGGYSYSVDGDGQGSHKYDRSDYCGDTPWAELAEKYIGK